MALKESRTERNARSSGGRDQFREWLHHVLDEFGLPAPDAGNVKWESDEMLKLLWLRTDVLPSLSSFAVVYQHHRQRDEILPHLKRALTRANKFPGLRDKHGV